jgi:hypothetical protein
MSQALTPMEQVFNQTFARLMTLRDADARRGPHRRVREFARRLASDLGGSEVLSIAQQQLIQRAAMLAALCEHTETCLLLGREDISIPDYLAAISVQKRLLEALGLERRQRDVTPPSVADYLKHKQQRAAS